ncbi:MAG: sigma-54-dependent Fis family transcriptional regulator [Deltaproteobacteria bacterium]|nr:sigma-54-dependent Fis family transcriptional regulator [Deltaproteobacteria bacterium]
MSPSPQLDPSTHANYVLVVDDEPAFRRMLETTISGHGCRARGAASGEEALELVQQERPELVFLDLRMSRTGLDGLETLRQLRQRCADLPVVMVTAHGDVQVAVAAMKAGALDFLEKPLDLREVRRILEQLLSARSSPAREQLLFGGICPADGAMQSVLELLAAAAESSAPVLITGESGTGKELAAAFVHERSSRSRASYVKVNCAAIPANLLEPELFGHEAGAFTGAHKARPGKFEIADGGTILLDEIAELDTRLQAKLLRVLQEKEVERVGSPRPRKVDVRVIATTNRDLGQAIAAQQFRQDLYFRLNVFEVVLPPLRQRRQDLLPLAHRLAVELSPDRPRRLAAETELLLLGHSWPGNVRELRNAMERAVILARGGVIHPEHLPPNLQVARDGDGGSSAGGDGDGSDVHEEPGETRAEFAMTAPSPPLSSVHEMERKLIGETLEQLAGNRTRAAEALGISRRTLLYKLKRYGLG